MDSSGEGHIDVDEAEQGPVQEAEDEEEEPSFFKITKNQFQLKLLMKKKKTVITVMMKLLMRMTMYLALNQF